MLFLISCWLTIFSSQKFNLSQRNLNNLRFIKRSFFSFQYLEHCNVLQLMDFYPYMTFQIINFKILINYLIIRLILHLIKMKSPDKINSFNLSLCEHLMLFLISCWFTIFSSQKRLFFSSQKHTLHILPFLKRFILFYFVKHDSIHCNGLQSITPSTIYDIFNR